MASPMFKELLQSGTPKLGLFVFEFATPGIALIAQEARADFLVLDMEHSGFGFETVKMIAMACRGIGMPLAVRIAHRHPNEVSRALDAGSAAIMAPLVSTADEARALVSWASYPPEGSRGVGMILPHDGYRAGTVTDKTADANARRTLLVQIETREGAENADAIAAVPGVDCLWIGHMDLSCSLDIPGQFDHPDFKQAVAAVGAAARKHGKSLGRLAGTVPEARRLIDEGFGIVALYTDIGALQQRLAEGIAAVRARS